MKPFMTTLLTATLALLLAGTAHAQILLKGGTVLTATGQTIESGDVLIGAEGRIEAVGPTGTLKSAKAKVVDVTGKVVTPGLIDAHTNLGVHELSAEKNTVDSSGGKGPVRPAFQVADGFNFNSMVLPVALSHGVTSAVVAPTGGFVQGQAAWIDLDQTRGYGSVARRALTVHVDFTNGGVNSVGGSKGRAALRLRELYDDARFFEKNRKNYDAARSRRLSASRLDLEAIIATFKRQKPVVFKARRAADILKVLELAKELDIAPVILDGAEAWMVAKELKSAGASVILDATANSPNTFESLGARDDNAALLTKAGVPVVLSTFETHNVRNLRQKAGNAIRAGMPRDAALASVTRNAAAMAGVADDYGTLEKGKFANLVVWSGDPFEFSTQVERIFVKGRQVSLGNRQRALFNRYKKLKRRAPATKPTGSEPVDLAEGEKTP